MPKVSVIVPIYQVEKYLEKCLDTLVNQTLEEIEIILVNDGSTDDSGKIAKKYCETIYLEKKMADYLVLEILEFLMQRENI